MRSLTATQVAAAAVITIAAVLLRQLAFADTSSPVTTQQLARTRNEAELARMQELLQQARDYVKRQKDVLGAFPPDVQPLLAEAQQHSQELQSAIELQDVRRARSAFRRALGAFERIRLRIRDAIDIQNPGTTPSERATDDRDDVLALFRSACSELQLLADQNPDAAVDAELTRIQGAIDALAAQMPAPEGTVLRERVQTIRDAIQAAAVTISDRTEASQ